MQLLKTLEGGEGSILGSSPLISNSFSIRDFVLLAMVNADPMKNFATKTEFKPGNMCLAGAGPIDPELLKLHTLRAKGQIVW